MGESPDSDVQEVIDWWREYGFKRGDCEYADVNVQLLERLDALRIEGQMQVFSWIDENGY
jgi:hypothetical protein